MYLSISLIFIGSTLLIFATRNIYNIIPLIGKKRKAQKYWRVLLVLTLFFVLGYWGSIALIRANIVEFLVYLVGLVFFFGALFVVLVSRIGLNTISDMEAEVRARTKDMRLAQKEAEKANQAKSQFLATMSHEVRTPLTSIIATVDILSELKLNKKQSEYVHILSRASSNLINQVNDILDLSKIEANRLELANTPMCLNDSIESVLSIMSVRCQEKDIGLETQLDIPEALYVQSDPIRLEQVLINLIGNSIKFTLAGHVRLEIKKLSENDKEIQLNFTVSDTGIGIPSDHIHTVFESFSQVDTSVTRRFGGTGLGLQICKSIVEMMGGQIHVKSKEHIGTSFWFAIHFSKAQNYTPVQAKAKAANVDLNKMQVLLVEDNEDNRFLFQAFLKASGIHLDTAKNGAVAVQKVYQKYYDLIFMDIQMPVMDGFTAMKKIRQWEKQKGTQNDPLSIVALTASVTKADIMQSFECGCNEYLRKPIRKKTLLDAVARYANQRHERLTNLKAKLDLSKKQQKSPRSQVA